MFSSPSTIAGVINFEKVTVKGDFACITLTLPHSALDLLQVFLGSAASLASFVNTKSRHAKAIAVQRTPAKKAASQAFYQDRVQTITTLYKEQRAAGADHRTAVKAVLAHFAEKGQELTCGLIEEFLRQEMPRGYRK